MDSNMRAFKTVQAARAEPLAPNKRRQSSQKNGLRGGPTRAKLIDPERRSGIAPEASVASWAQNEQLTAVR